MEWGWSSWLKEICQQPLSSSYYKSKVFHVHMHISQDDHRVQPTSYSTVRLLLSNNIITDKACCTQTGPAHAAGHVEMAWTDDSTQAIFLACATVRHHCSQKRLESSDFNTSTVSQATKTNRLPCGYLYCSSYWIATSSPFWIVQWSHTSVWLTQACPISI